MFSSPCTSVPACPSDRSCLGEGAAGSTGPAPASWDASNTNSPDVPQVPMDRQKGSEHIPWNTRECSRCVRFHGHVEGRRVPCAKPILQLSPHEVLCVDNIAKQQHSLILFLSERELDFWRWPCSFSWWCKSSWVHMSFKKMTQCFFC